MTAESMRLFLDPAIKSQDDDWGFIQVQRYHFHVFWVVPSIMKTVVEFVKKGEAL